MWWVVIWHAWYGGDWDVTIVWADSVEEAVSEAGKVVPEGERPRTACEVREVMAASGKVWRSYDWKALRPR